MNSEVNKIKKLNSLFHKLKNSYEEKIHIFNLYIKKDSLGSKSFFIRFKSRFIKHIKEEISEGKSEEKIINSLVHNIDSFINKELSNDPKDKLIKYSELKKLVSLFHQTKALISINIKQLHLIEECHKDNSLFKKKESELKELIHNESGIIQKEESLENSIEKSDSSSFTWDYTVVGYGSLMNSEQIAGELCAVSDEVKKQYALDPEKTIRERLIPVLVFGWKRVFFRRATSPKWTLPRNVRRKALAAMDLQASHKHYFNAVAIKVSKKELEQLYKREIDYKLTHLNHVKNFVTGESVPNCICFKSPIAPLEEQKNAKLEDDLKKRFAYLGKPQFEGVKFHATKFMREGDMTPPPKYFDVCVSGAKGLDPLLGTHGMYDSFLDTTYLYYIDKILTKDTKVVSYQYYGQYSVREFLKLGYKLKGAHVLPIQFRKVV